VTVMLVLMISCENFVLYTSSSSIDHQSTPKKSAKNQVDGRHFGVNRPIDPNALLFYAWMMSEGYCFCPTVYPFLISAFD